jgi:hypothetical protein
MFDVAVAECLFRRRDGSRIDGAHVRALILFLVMACAGLLSADAAPSADVARRC